jgi:predicted amidohydrolase YtcJ
MSSGQRVVLGDIVTMDPTRPRAEGMALDGERLLAVGTKDEALAALPAGTEVVSAPGAALVPGLVDSHVHMLWAGLDASRLSLSGVQSVGEVLDRIRDYAAEHPDHPWLVGSADFDPPDLAEGRLPSCDELERATGGRPLFLDRRSHDGLVNNAALAAAGIDAATPDPVGGVIERDADGAATGLLVERPAVELVTAAMPPTDLADLVRALETIQPVYHAAGLTGVVDPALLPEELDAFAELRRRGGLTVRTTAMPLAQTSLGGAEAAARLRAGEHLPGTGDDWLRIGAVKVFFDGGGSLGTAMLREPWPGAEGDYRGNQTVPTETLAEIAHACAAEGWSLGVHTVGGAAMDIVLDVFAEVDRETPIRPLRFSLIHAYLWPSAENIETAARLGVVVATQPPMQWQFAPGLVAKFGAERIGRATPVRSWLDGGVAVAGGSDGPGIPPEPLFGMWTARTRRIDGASEPVGIDEAISPEQALALYTTGACYAAFAEHERGMLRAGMLADWVAVSVDPLTASDDELADARVLQTVVGGRVVYGEA